MAAYLLDTTTFSLMVKRQSGVRTRVASLPAADRMAICSVVRGEVLYGLERMPHGKRRQDLEAKVTELFAALPCEPIPEAAADEYAVIKRETERKGARLDENDLRIAATALSLGAALVTTDSDFRRVRRLRVEDWTR
jgi:predicted nucleic acid-binding protein